MSEMGTDLLRDALAVLEKYGWIQNLYGSSGGARCMMGALGQAFYEGRDKYSEFDLSHHAAQVQVNGGYSATGWDATCRLKRAIKMITPDHYSSFTDPMSQVVSWNDASGRSYEDVVLAFKKAIEDDGE